ncbi:MAG: hypothetical protein ABII90_02755 [Bacteroidota bacterium]
MLIAHSRFAPTCAYASRPTVRGCSAERLSSFCLSQRMPSDDVLSVGSPSPSGRAGEG